jgi:hypothetical protein
MKVMVLTNGNLETREIGNELKDLQEIVGGYIEIPFISNVFNDNGIDVIINEEGKLIDGLTPEIAIVDEVSGKILDLVYGNCIFASHNDEGETIALNEEQMQIVTNELETIVELTNTKTFKDFEVRVLFV